MSSLVDRARMTVTSTGSGTLTLGAAVSGFQSFATAGVVNADAGIEYLIEDGVTAWEIGTGTYTSAGTTLSRALRSSSTGSLLAVSTNAIVSIIPTANTLIAKAPLASPALTGTPTGPTAALNTNTTQLATTQFVLGQLSTTNPLMNSAVAIGTGTTFARTDHVHPIDTSRAPVANPTFTGTQTLPSVNIDGGTIDNTVIGGSTRAAGSFTTVTTTSTISAGGNGIAYPSLGSSNYYGLRWDSSYLHALVDSTDVGRVALFDASGNLTTPSLGAVTAGGSITANAGFSMNQSGMGAYWTGDASYCVLSMAGGWRWLWNRSNGDLSWQNSSGANLLYIAATGALSVGNDTYFGLSIQGSTRLMSYANTWYWAFNNTNGDLSWNGGGASRLVSRVSDGLFYNNWGTVGGYGAYINLSDARTKSDIASAPHGLAQVRALTPRTFRRKSRGGVDHPVELGFVAQEVAEILPEAVSEADFANDPDAQYGVQLDPIVAAVVNAIKELAADVAELKAARV